MKTMTQVRRLATAIAFGVAAFSAQFADAAPVKNIVLVHGYFADGSGWQAVSRILTRDGYKVSVVQEPETSFEDDVAATTRVLDAQDGPSILVGHSYGGAVITQAGNDEHVAGLVYIAAFEPGAGESLKDLTGKFPAAIRSIKETSDSHLYIDPSHFHADFAADVPQAEAAFMASSQVMPAIKSFTSPVTQPAWKAKPSWAVVATADRTVSPELERWMARRAGSTVVEVNSSHVAFLSHPAEIAKVIEQAASTGDSR
jgi:pimeloyl-ACP methyl ester carboxylesterase